MNFVELKHPTEDDCHKTSETKIRHSIKGKDPLILSEIYQEKINIEESLSINQIHMQNHLQAI